MSAPARPSGLPPRPDDHAPAAAWKEYADAMEAVAAASEHRANFLHARLNKLISSPAWKILRKARNFIDAAPLQRSSGKMKHTPSAYVPKVAGAPLVSILIPFRDGSKFLQQCLLSLRAKTAYAHYELILIDNGSVEKRTQRLLKREVESGARVVRLDEPFNFSRLNNLGAKSARGKHLLLLNNDIEIIEPHWLGALLEQSQRDDVGAVGAKLLYPDGRIQHAGVVLGMDDIAGHVHKFVAGGDPVVGMQREFGAVTGACLMTRRDVFERLGGLNERDLPIAYQDVDYCLRAKELGLKVIYTPHAALIHHESASRASTNNPAEAAYMCRRWGRAIVAG